MQKLIEHPNVYFLATAEGKYNLCISTNSLNIHEVQCLILTIREHTRIEDLLFLPLYYEHSTPHEYLLEGIMDKPSLLNYEQNDPSFQYEFDQRKINLQELQQSEKYVLNEVEKQILDVLIRNAKSSLYDLSIKTRLSINGVKKKYCKSY